MEDPKQSQPPAGAVEPWRGDQLSSLAVAITQAEQGDLVDNGEACGWLEGFIWQHDR